MSRNPRRTAICSGKFASCTSNGQAEILGVERILAAMTYLPEGSEIVLTTDYRTTVREALRGFPSANKDTPEGKALKDLQERLLEMNRRRIHVLLFEIDREDPSAQAVFQHAHNAARRELQLEARRRLPKKRRRRLPQAVRDGPDRP